MLTILVNRFVFYTPPTVRRAQPKFREYGIAPRHRKQTDTAINAQYTLFFNQLCSENCAHATNIISFQPIRKLSVLNEYVFRSFRFGHGFNCALNVTQI